MTNNEKWFKVIIDKHIITEIINKWDIIMYKEHFFALHT